MTKKKSSGYNLLAESSILIKLAFWRPKNITLQKCCVMTVQKRTVGQHWDTKFFLVTSVNKGFFTTFDILLSPKTQKLQLKFGLASLLKFCSTWYSFIQSRDHMKKKLGTFGSYPGSLQWK